MRLQIHRVSWLAELPMATPVSESMIALLRLKSRSEAFFSFIRVEFHFHWFHELAELPVAAPA